MCPYSPLPGLCCMQGEGLCARGRAARKGRGKDQGECMQGEGLHTRGGGGCASEQASRAAHEQKGARTLSAPPAPSRST